MNIHELKKQLQNLFTDGLVIVVGSGLSCAEGLPGMGVLGDELKRRVAMLVGDKENQETWDRFSSRLDSGMGLEAALHEVVLSPDLEQTVVNVTADFIQDEENRVLADCFNGGRSLRFEQLLPHLSPSPTQHVDIVTTNYDRLIEYAVEAGGWGVDTGFLGRWLGHHDPSASALSFATGMVRRGKTSRLQFRKRVRLYKPHGSLDWYETTQGAVSTTLPLAARRLLITPGVGKYRVGYRQPFDAHREEANNAIDRASAILCLGYGFNDDHLQTHLVPRLQAGVPALLLTHGLTEGATTMLRSSPNAIALICSEDPMGTEVVTTHGYERMSDVRWWDLGEFIKGVLEP